MKKITTILIALLLLATAVAACGPGPVVVLPGDDPNQGQTGNDDSKVLRIWYDNDERFDELQQRFNAIHPDITIEYERVSHTEARGRLQLDGPAGIGPDVFFLPHDHIGNAILDGLIEPIDPTLQAALQTTLHKGAVDTVTVDGSMYAVPVTLENIALFYNKDLWGETPPTTMEEIIDFAQTYNNRHLNKWTIMWQINDAYHNYMWFSVHGMEFMGPNQDDYRKPGFDTQAAYDGISYMLYLRENLFDVPSGDAGYGATVAMFQNGNVPLTISGEWAIATAKDNDINFGVTKLPTVNGKQPICFLGIRAACMSSYTKNPELAKLFLEFLSNEHGAAFFYEAENRLPTFLDHSLIPGLSDDQYLAGILEQTPYTVPMPIIPEVNMGGWDGLLDLFVFAWDGQLTVAESQIKAMDTYRTLLQAAGR
ncbi:MAG: maltose ABC transporter substrate-binding protein, partial [Oscillospiraceae bacterium]|nr:maltose ABC transporter substrate-binding protein [Oscillospiraceae bacterium]